MHQELCVFTKVHGIRRWWGGKAGTLCTYGDPNVLSADIGTSQLAQGPSAHTALVQVERYREELPAVTGFGGPLEVISENGGTHAAI